MRVIALLLLTTVSLCAETPDPVVLGVVEHFAFSKADLGDDRRGLPVGVFDSGIGGLTVLEAILALDEFDNATLKPGADGIPDFEKERFVYLGDQANMPYGNYPAAGRTDFLRELILRDAAFLLGSKDKPPVKAIVIACNTATAYGLEDIRAALAAWDLPVIVIGVVEAGARGVAQDLPSELSENGVGVLATVGTCSSEAYPKTIQKISGQLGKSSPQISQQGSVALAGAIEGDPAFLSDGATVASHLREDLVALVRNHRDAGNRAPISRLVLGCTHFPLIAGEIRSTLTELKNDAEFGTYLADEVTLIDPAKLTARELFLELARARLRAPEKPGAGHAFYISVPNPDDPEVKLDPSGARLDRDYQYARNPGQPGRQDTKVAPMRPVDLPESSLHLLQTRLPKVWAALEECWEK